MGKISKLAKVSPLMNIRIKVGEELIRFNLYDELRIDDNQINRDIMAQPRLYSFIGAVHVKCIAAQEKAESEKKRIYAEQYAKYKGEPCPKTGRPNSDDLAKALAEKSKLYQLAIRRAITAKENTQTIKNCLESFDQRKDLIQSISSNLRSNV